MGKIWHQLDISDFAVLFGFSTTLVIEIVTLLRVLYGSRHRFVIKILATFIGGNLARLGAETVWINMLKTEDFSTKKF